jgi:hypothetical protein
MALQRRVEGAHWANRKAGARRRTHKGEGQRGTDGAIQLATGNAPPDGPPKKPKTMLKSPGPLDAKKQIAET